MEGAEESTELWQHIFQSPVFLFTVNANKENKVRICQFLLHLSKNSKLVERLLLNPVVCSSNTVISVLI